MRCLSGSREPKESRSLHLTPFPCTSLFPLCSELTSYEASVVRTTFAHFAKDKYLPRKRLAEVGPPVGSSPPHHCCPLRHCCAPSLNVRLVCLQAIRSLGLGPTPPEYAEMARDMDGEWTAADTRWGPCLTSMRLQRSATRSSRSRPLCE